MAERRVLHLLGGSTGGIRRHVALLAEELPAHGWTAQVAGPPGVMAGAGPQHFEVPVARHLPTLVAGRRALGEAVAGVELVHAHGLTAGWLAATLRPRPPVVVTVHNLVLDEVRGRSAPALRALEALLPRAADRLIAVSADIARRFSGAVGADRIAVIAPAGPHPRPHRPPEEVRAALGAVGRPLVVAVARLNPQKDLPTLLRAAAHLRRSVPDVVVAVVGEGREEAALRALVDELGLADTVVLAGPSDDAAGALAAADVVALSSRWESGPLVVAEALALGRPVVATPVGFVPDLVDDGVSGRLVPAADPRRLADALADVLGDPDAAASMGAAGRARVAERLAPGRLVGAVAAVYDELVDGRA